MSGNGHKIHKSRHGYRSRLGQNCSRFGNVMWMWWRPSIRRPVGHYLDQSFWRTTLNNADRLWYHLYNICLVCQVTAGILLYLNRADSIIWNSHQNSECLPVFPNLRAGLWVSYSLCSSVVGVRPPSENVRKAFTAQNCQLYLKKSRFTMLISFFLSV